MRSVLSANETSTVCEGMLLRTGYRRSNAADVGLGGLDEARDQRGVLREHVRLVRENVRRVGHRNLLGDGHGKPGELVLGLMVLSHLGCGLAILGAVALRRHARLLTWSEEKVRGG